MRVLVVDDSRFTRALLRREFDGAYEVFEAGNGREAIAILVKHEPDIVLVDLLMPVMNGYEFVKEARRLGYKGPLLICSANTQTSVESKVREIGATDFVTKPELLVPGRARAVVEEKLRHAASGPVAPTPPPLHLEGMISDAVQSLAEAISLLSATSIRIGSARQGRPEDIAMAPPGGPPAFRVRVVLGDLVCGVARLLFPEGGGPEAYPAPDRVAAMNGVEEGAADRLVRAFARRFARHSGRELSVGEIQFPIQPANGDGFDSGSGEVVLISHFALSGIAGQGILEVSGDRVLWLRLTETVSPGGTWL